jgi:hypothetical protein
MVRQASVVIPPHLHGSPQDGSKEKNPRHSAQTVSHPSTMTLEKPKTLSRLFLFAIIRGAFRFAKKYDMPKTINPIQ